MPSFCRALRAASDEDNNTEEEIKALMSRVGTLFNESREKWINDRFLHLIDHALFPDPEELDANPSLIDITLPTRDSITEEIAGESFCFYDLPEETTKDVFDLFSFHTEVEHITASPNSVPDNTGS